MILESQMKVNTILLLREQSTAEPTFLLRTDNSLHNTDIVSAKKDFIVNSIFDLNGKQTVAEGIKRLIDNELNSAA